MPNLAATLPLVAMPDVDKSRLVAADLRALIAQIESSMRLIDAAMMEAGQPQDDGGSQSGSIDIFVLDDVTPCYATAGAALDACRAGLGRALQCLSETGTPA